MRPHKISERLITLLQLNNEKAIDMVNKTGIPKSSLSLYLNDKREPRQDILTKIALIYNVNEAWLMGYDLPMDRPEVNWDPKTQEMFMCDFEYIGVKDKLDEYIHPLIEMSHTDRTSLFAIMDAYLASKGLKRDE